VSTVSKLIAQSIASALLIVYLKAGKQQSRVSRFMGARLISALNGACKSINC